MIEFDFTKFPTLLSFSENPMLFQCSVRTDQRIEPLEYRYIRVVIDDDLNLWYPTFPYSQVESGVDGFYNYTLSFDVSSFISSYISKNVVALSSVSAYRAIKVSIEIDFDNNYANHAYYYPDWRYHFFVVPGYSSSFIGLKDVISCRMVGDRLCYLSSEIQASQLFVCNLSSSSPLRLSCGSNTILTAEPFSQQGYYYLVDVTTLDFGNKDRCYLNLGDNAVCEIIVKEATSICSILFKSRIGAMERFALLGHAKSVPSFSEESKYLSYQDGIYVPKKQIIPYQQKVEIHTGFLNSTRYSLLLEALVASEVYFCFLDGSEEVRIPVYISVKEPSFSYRGNDLQGYKIEVEFPKDLAPYQLSKLESFLMTESSEYMTTENNINIIL